MTATPAPESVRRFAQEVERALSIILEATRAFELELREDPDAPFPADRPVTRDQLTRLAERLKSSLLTDEERGKLQKVIDKGLTYGKARALIEHIDGELEARASGENHLHEREGVR